MDKKSTIIIAVILILALIVFVVISFQKSMIDSAKQEDAAATLEWANKTAEESTAMLLAPRTVITAKHAYRSGEHIIAGELPLPTACHILESQGTVSEDKKLIFIELSSSVKTGEVCAQVITPARFKLSLKANKDATISATYNGVEVTLNLLEAGQNENLDDFELYLKG